MPFIMDGKPCPACLLWEYHSLGLLAVEAYELIALKKRQSPIEVRGDILDAIHIIKKHEET